MEHDEKCEKVSTSRAIAKRVQLSRAEFAALVMDTMAFYVCCNCGERGESRFPAERTPRELRIRTVDFVLTARQGRIGLGEMPGLRSVGRVEEEDDRKVIRIDFRNRRRID